MIFTLTKHTGVYTEDAQYVKDHVDAVHYADAYIAITGS